MNNSLKDPRSPIVSPDTDAIFGRLFKDGEYLYTSLGANYSNATFGRDSIITAHELLDIDPRIARDVIIRLASYQGVKERTMSAEEPGRIHHEHRELKTWGTDGLVSKIGKLALSLIWGGNSKQMTTYFSMDSTPLYLSLVADYATIEPSILSEVVTRNDGRRINVEQSVVDANNWIENHIAESGLVEINRRNPTSLIHQTWKDSRTGYVEENGEMINILKPIAYLNIQALSANGLSRSAELISETNPSVSKKWQDTADSIINNTIEGFWMEDEEYFASAIQEDLDGHKKRVNTLQSDAGWLLNTIFFDKLEENDRKKYISAIAKKLFSNDFLTDVGIRSRALKYSNNSNVADYHGALTSWPVDTYQIAQGLRRQGLIRLAEQLEVRVLNAINASGDHYEFYYVMPDGKVILNPEEAKIKRPGNKTLPIRMYPESNIAWTVAATLAIKDRLDHKQDNGCNQDPESWQSILEAEILSKIKNVSVAGIQDELDISEVENVYLDMKKGSYEMTLQILEQLGRTALRCINRAGRKSLFLSYRKRLRV